MQVTYKYIPYGYGPGADTSRLIVNDLSKYWKESASVEKAPLGGAHRDPGEHTPRATGHFEFHRARWEDMPSQFHIVNTWPTSQSSGSWAPRRSTRRTCDDERPDRTQA